ncbi:MAG: NAD-binding protein [Akkermansiaceae bacterium]|nr:NAD-binding protein [Armatimonadota bacterium]
MPSSQSRPALLDESETEAPHVIVCGLGRFGLRVVECLREQDPDARITVVTNESTRADRLRRAEKLNARIVLGDFRFDDVRADAGIAKATSLVLSSAMDADNLETALDARSEAPEIRILMRLDEGRIADRLMSDFGIDLVLSPPALAAREFAHAALTPIPVDPGMSKSQDPEKHNIRSNSALNRTLRLPNRYDTRRPLMLLALLLLALFLTGVAIFQHALQIPIVDAIYFTATIISTVGFGDYNLLNQGPFIKLFGTLMMFSGVALVALLTSFVTNFFLSGAANRMRAERIAEWAHDHVIVCGLGTVGFEIVRDLSEQHIQVVVVDNSPDSGAVRLLEGRVSVIFGDATSEEALLRAGVLRARALIASLSDDAKNLEIGLSAQTLAQDRGPDRPLRLVLRCFDADLARRIHAVSKDYTLLSSAEIAAPVFARAALAPLKKGSAL